MDDREQVGRLNEVLERIRQSGRVPSSVWPREHCLPEDLGLVSDEDGTIRLPLHAQPLCETALSSLTGRVRDAISVVQTTVSTNSDLLSVGQSTSIHRRVLLAEHQSGGRGRRGRSWLSPYARSLSISIGFETSRSAFQLQGVSLVIGLAVCRVLRDLGCMNCGLKWPNDLVDSGKKVAGILVEHQTFDKRSQLVIGIGVNYCLTEAEKRMIDQPVTDLLELGVTATRTQVAAEIVGSVLELLDEFVESGFARFRQAFRRRHVFQDCECRVITPTETVIGRVADVDAYGCLVLETPSGDRSFVSGEVSLRDV